MAGSTIGRMFRVTTWGEATGDSIGVVVDGVPAGLELSEAGIQAYINRRKPQVLSFTANRHENDFVSIHSGINNGISTGAPIAMTITNSAIRAKSTEEASTYRPGTPDFAYEAKYGIFDTKDSGRASFRETAARVAAGAVACTLLEKLGISFCSYVSSIGPVSIKYSNCTTEALAASVLNMPDAEATEAALKYLEEVASSNDSCGGIIEVIVSGMPAGVGEPVFDKLDADLAKAVMSIGAIKGVEVGDGFKTAQATGLLSNDLFSVEDKVTTKNTNHSGGMLSGVSDGSEIILRAAVKPTAAAATAYDISEAPRAVVVVESMMAITLVDLLFENMTSRMDQVERFYKQ